MAIDVWFISGWLTVHIFGPYFCCYIVTSFRERTMLASKNVRAELNKSCGGEDMNTTILCRMLEEHCPPLAYFIRWSLQFYERLDLIPVGNIKFLKAITSVSPV